VRRLAKKERNITVYNRDDLDPEALKMCFVILARQVKGDRELMKIIETNNPEKKAAV